MLPCGTTRDQRSKVPRRTHSGFPVNVDGDGGVRHSSTRRPQQFSPPLHIPFMPCTLRIDRDYTRLSTHSLPLPSLRPYLPTVPHLHNVALWTANGGSDPNNARLHSVSSCFSSTRTANARTSLTRPVLAKRRSYNKLIARSSPRHTTNPSIYSCLCTCACIVLLGPAPSRGTLNPVVGRAACCSVVFYSMQNPEGDQRHRIVG